MERKMKSRKQHNKNQPRVIKKKHFSLSFWYANDKIKILKYKKINKRLSIVKHSIYIWICECQVMNVYRCLLWRCASVN